MTERDREIVRLYVEEQLGTNRIGPRFGLTAGGVYRLLKRRGIRPRSYKEASALNKQTGPRAAHWKGGVKHGDGRVFLLRPQHPYALVSGYIRRSRLVWEEHTGHVVQPAEVVHHRNHVKDDDRFENLELFSSESEHQRLAHGPDPQRVDEARRLRAEGLSYAKIGLHVGVHQTTVLRWLSRDRCAMASGPARRYGK